MKKNGFTLVELVAVIVLLALVMILIVPGLNNVTGENNKKKFAAYENMMLEYARSYPNYKSKSYICLSALDLEPVDGNTTCHGNVTYYNNMLTPYLSCTSNSSNVYTTAAPKSDSSSTLINNYNKAKANNNYC